jgi:hypothetical protein
MSLVGQNLLQQLSHRTLGLENRAAMIHDAGQIGIGERNPPEW